MSIVLTVIVIVGSSNKSIKYDSCYMRERTATKRVWILDGAPGGGDNGAMKRPAVFFDRDNTLIASDGYLGEPEKVALIAGAADAIARLRGLGFAIVVVSNQSGIARGMFDEAATEAVNARMSELLLEANAEARIDGHQFCPHHPEAVIERYRVECDCRKPRPGMLLKAAGELSLDLSRSWLVGDAPRDIEAGAAAGCRTILFVDSSLSASPATLENGKVKADFEVTSLKEAADVIDQNARITRPPE